MTTPTPPEAAATVAADSQQPSGSGLPRGRESRTWELELLISGAVLFALVRGPGLLDRWFTETSLHVSHSTGNTLFLVYYMAKIMSYVLIASFVVHLLSRAYWVGLVGLHTAYPGGVRWDELKYGPASKEVYRERQPSLPAQIERADRFCSTIFPLAFSIVLTFLLGALLAAVVSALLLVLVRLTGWEVDTREVTVWVLAFAAVPPMLLGVVDRYGARWVERNDRARRLIRSGTRFYYTVMAAWAFAPVMNVLMSNARKTHVYAVYYLLIPLAIVFFFVHDVMAPRGALALDGYRYLPAAAAGDEVNPVHYENLRDPGRTPAFVPLVQADVITGPYLRLFLPYHPERHTEAASLRCPELEPLTDGELRLGVPDTVAASHRAAAIACLSTLQRVYVNGREATELRYRFYRDPGTGLRGLVTYLPTEGMPRGENLLTVDPLPRVARDQQRRRPPPPAFHIPFWVEGR